MLPCGGGRRGRRRARRGCERWTRWKSDDVSELGEVGQRACGLCSCTCSLIKRRGAQSCEGVVTLTQTLEGGTHTHTYNTTRVTDEQTYKPSDTHETQSRPPRIRMHPVLNMNPHPRLASIDHAALGGCSLR